MSTKPRVGSFDQLPSGKWRARIKVDGRTFTKTMPTKREAQTWARDIESDVRRGLVATPVAEVAAPAGCPTVGALWETYRSTLRVAPRTALYYAQAWDRLSPLVSDVLASDVHPSDVRAIRAHLESTGLGTTRCKGAVQLLGRILQVAVIDGHIVTNPVTVAAIRWPRPRPMDRPVLSAADVAALAACTTRTTKKGKQIPSLRDRALVLVLGWTGLRIGEAFALQRRDVDLEHGTLIVRRGVAEVGQQVVGDTKTHQTRVVTLPGAVVEVLREQMRAIPINPEAWLFPNRAGKPLWLGSWDRNVWHPTLVRWNAQRSEEGLPEIHLRHHDMRSACASLLVDAGASVKDVQAHLGHADVATTLGIYARVRPGRSEALAARMDALIAGA